MEFEWDSAKAAANLEKHAVDFATAARIFDDPDILVIIDPRRYTERRHQAIGIVAGMILFVAYTMRSEGICRIISARRASRRERKAYSIQAGAGPSA